MMDDRSGVGAPTRRTALVAGAAALSGAAFAVAQPAPVRPRRVQGPVLPAVSAQDLNGAPFAFPADARGRPAVGVFGYRRDTAWKAERLTGLLDGLAPAFPGLRWWRFPVLPDGPGIRWATDTGMRSGVRSTDRRARVVTLYVDDLGAFARATGFTDPRGAWVGVIADGRLLASATHEALPDDRALRGLLAPFA